MTTQTTQILTRGALTGLISAIGAAIIYISIALLTGGKPDSSTFVSALVTGVVTFFIALVFFYLFTFYFSRKKA